MPQRTTPPFRPTLALLVVFFCAAGIPRAEAQISSAWLNYTPTETFAGWGSTRLQAMGDIQVSVVDDRKLIDIYEYAKNPGGIVTSRDTSIVEFPYSYQEFSDTYYNQTNGAYQQGVGIHGVVRPNRPWAVGFDVDYGGMSATRHTLCPSPDDCRFIRDFNLPVAPQADPVVGDKAFGAGVTSPYFSMTYGRVFKKRLQAGLRLGYQSEDEDRRISEPYDLDLTSTSFEITGGLGYVLPILENTVTVAGFATYVDNQIQGLSETSLNEDNYDYSRPEVAFGGQIALKKGDWLTGVIDLRHSSFDGQQDASVNWAPQFFLNPLPSENLQSNVFKKSWTSFESGFRHDEGDTRWMVNVPGKPVHIGLGYAYFEENEWITVNDEVLSSANELNVQRLGYRFAGGFSFDMPEGKGVIAAEARIAHESRLDLTFDLPEISMITYTYHLGAEYRVWPKIPLRVGTILIRDDPNRYDGVAPFKGTGLTLGAGYVWEASGTKIDFAYGHNHFSYSPDDPSEEVGYGDTITLYVQHLF